MLTDFLSAQIKMVYAVSSGPVVPVVVFDAQNREIVVNRVRGIFIDMVKM